MIHNTLLDWSWHNWTFQPVLGSGAWECCKVLPVNCTNDYSVTCVSAEGAAGDEVRKVIRVQESTAAIEPSTLQQQLHPACSNDHAANDIQLMIKPESKLVVELSNNISCCRSADDVQIKNLHESARSSFLPDQDQVPSNCWTSRSKQLEYGSPISSTVASPSSEILDADSPRHIDSCTTLSQLTQVMDLKLLRYLKFESPSP